MNKREKDQKPYTQTGTKGKFLGNRSQNKYGFTSVSFILSYPKSLATSYICLAYFNQTVLESIIKNDKGPLFTCKHHLVCPNHALPSLPPALPPPPEGSTRNISSLFRCFQAPLAHLQKAVMPKSNICSTNPSPPAGLMSPWILRMRRAGEDCCPNTFRMTCPCHCEFPV